MICENQEFVQLCGQGFFEDEARAVCRDLGFVTGSKWTYINDV